MEKQELREHIWDGLEERGAARFPYPPHGRIPNFAGAKAAAERLSENEAWQEAATIKSNPDAPQLPVRRAALRQGKTVYMAVPRLRNEQCFLRLDPAVIDDIDHATTVGGSAEVGVPVAPREMDPIDLIVSGSVAVNHEGSRVGKGEGYSDLEFALLRECGVVDDSTTTVSTLHETQFVESVIPTHPHDVPIDWVFTPDQAIHTEAAAEKPTGIEWDVLSADQIDEIPILQQLNPQ